MDLQKMINSEKDNFISKGQVNVASSLIGLPLIRSKVSRGGAENTPFVHRFENR